MPCSVVVGYQRFEVPCCLHLQGEVKRCYPTTTLDGVTTEKKSTYNLSKKTLPHGISCPLYGQPIDVENITFALAIMHSYLRSETLCSRHLGYLVWNHESGRTTQINFMFTSKCYVFSVTCYCTKELLSIYWRDDKNSHGRHFISPLELWHRNVRSPYGDV